MSVFSDYIHQSQGYSNFRNPKDPRHKDLYGIEHRICGALGLAGEASETLEVWEQAMAPQAIDSNHIRLLLKKELGDIYWYVAQVSDANQSGVSVTTHMPEPTTPDADFTRVVILAGKHADYIKKCGFHGHVVAPDLVRRQMNEIVAYLNRFCVQCGFSVTDVLDTNIAKLAARFPEGVFSTDRSVNRSEADT